MIEIVSPKNVEKMSILKTVTETTQQPKLRPRGEITL